MAQFGARLPTPGDTFKEKPKKSDKAKGPDLVPGIRCGEHGRYQIKSGRLGDNFIARAFPKPPTKTRGIVAEATGNTHDAAIAALHEIIDAHAQQQASERRRDPHLGVSVPTTEEFVEAIRQVALTPPQIAMLTALSLAGEEGLTEDGLARAAGYKSRLSAGRSLAKAGFLIAAYLSVDVTSGREDTDAANASVIVFRRRSARDDEPGAWILHAEMSEAMRACA